MPRWSPVTDEQYVERWKARCVITPSGCWDWQRCCQPFRNMKPGQRGYAAASYRGKNMRLNRAMLQIKLGRPLLPGMQACHTCDHPPCLNPDHLYEATNSQNHRDGGKRKRMQGQHKTHCLRGHEYTPETTYMAPHGDLRWRHCRVCERERGRREWAAGKGLARQRRWRAKRKAALETA